MSCMSPPLTASWIQRILPDRCLIFPVPCRMASWRPEDESVYNTCSTCPPQTNSMHLLMKIPSLNVLVIACNSASQLERLTTRCVRELPNRYAPLSTWMPHEVDLLWVWLELQSLSLKLSSSQHLSVECHRPCPPVGMSRRTQ